MVLADDNFATIVAAVRQGRIIFGNLKKFIYFLLSCNISEVLTVFMAMLVGFPLPLAAGADTLDKPGDRRSASTGAGRGPAREGRDGAPAAPRLGENILAVRKQLWLAWQGLLITVGALAAFILSNYWLGYDWQRAGRRWVLEYTDMARTILFTTLVLAQILHSFNMRSESRSFFLSAPWENRYLFGSVILSLALQVFVLYAPFMQTAFKTHPPTAQGWLLIVLVRFDTDASDRPHQVARQRSPVKRDHGRTDAAVN